jgi:hypothetical protein
VAEKGVVAAGTGGRALVGRSLRGVLHFLSSLLFLEVPPVLRGESW